MSHPPPETAPPKRGRRRPDEQIAAEQVSLLLRNYLDQFPALIAVGPAMAASLWGQVPMEQLLPWAAAYLASVFERGAFARRYFRDVPAASEARSWGMRFAARVALSGFVIGTVGIWMFSIQSLPYSLFVFSFLFLASLVGPVLYSPFMPAFYAYLPGILLPIGMSVLISGELPRVWGALGFAIFVIILLGSGHGYNQSIRRSFELRVANANLIRRLTRKNMEAERANAAKSRFLAAASHDLRQPLQSLALLTATLGLRLGEGEERQIVRRISSAVEAVDQQFSALMEISRLDAGLVTPEYREFPLEPLLAKLRDEFAPLAAAKGLRLGLPSRKYWVRSDPDLLERTLRNLLANAIRYTEEGAVMLLARWRPGGVELEVRDSGIGIPPEQQEYVFEDFYQLNNPARDRRKGLGLGLAIVKRLADLLGHPVRVCSREGRGSIFSLRVPRAAPGPR
jgi:two-component system, sensor histidine kinase